MTAQPLAPIQVASKPTALSASAKENVAVAVLVPASALLTPPASVSWPEAVAVAVVGASLVPVMANTRFWLVVSMVSP